MTGDISLFTDFKAKKKGYVTYGDNNKGAILGKGSSHQKKMSQKVFLLMAQMYLQKTYSRKLF